MYIILGVYIFICWNCYGYTVTLGVPYFNTYGIFLVNFTANNLVLELIQLKQNLSWKHNKGYFSLLPSSFRVRTKNTVTEKTIDYRMMDCSPVHLKFSIINFYCIKPQRRYYNVQIH